MAFLAGTLGSLLGWGLMLPAPFLMGPVLVSTLFAILRADFAQTNLGAVLFRAGDWYRLAATSQAAAGRFL